VVWEVQWAAWEVLWVAWEVLWEEWAWANLWEVWEEWEVIGEIIEKFNLRNFDEIRKTINSILKLI
jgi:hypothetical protein